VSEFYHDAARRLLVYRPANPDLVCQHVPEARRLNGQYVAFPSTLANVQVARLLDLPVPNIMELDGYDWPIERGRKPLAHQKMMAAFMASHPRCFNLSDMGTMKTLSCLWAADYLMSQHPKGEFRALVVAPLSILERVWGSAIFGNFLGRRTYQIVYGSAERREEQIQQPADFYIINFDGVTIGARTRGKWVLEGLARRLSERSDVRLVIIDEGSAYRDSQTRRSRVARQVLAPKPYFWCLTGTPTPNGPTDAYGLAKLVNNAWGESYHAYHNRVMTRWAQWVWKPKPGANEAARRLLTPAIRVDIKDVWDGPPMTVQQREVPLTDEQARLHRAMKREMHMQLASGQPITAANEAAARLKFIQVSLGGVYDEQHSSHPVDAAPRVKELLAVIREARQKVVVFVPLTNIIDMLYKRLTEEGIGTAVLNGAVHPRERSELLTSFGGDGGPRRVLLCDPATTSHGINEMVAADTAVWYGPTDRTELYLQGNKRVHRPGQRWPVTIVQLVSNPLEREIFRRLEANETLQGLLLTMVKEGRI
jgi:SNF2 family DNA or RNA helicase